MIFADVRKNRLAEEDLDAKGSREGLEEIHGLVGSLGLRLASPYTRVTNFKKSFAGALFEKSESETRTN